MTQSLLCVDSGSARLVVAAVVDGKVVAQAESDAAASHGVVILDLVERVTLEAGLARNGFSALVVALGPGSFTGLRTSLSTFKGLALAWKKPLVGVPTLRALARSAHPTERVTCCVDARKGEVYGAIYAGDDELLAPCALSPAEFAKAAQPFPSTHWSGDGPARFPDVMGAVNVSWPHAYPAMAALAALAQPKLPHGDDVATLEPQYVRRTATELRLGGKR